MLFNVYFCDYLPLANIVLLVADGWRQMDRKRAAAALLALAACIACSSAGSS